MVTVQYLTLGLLLLCICATWTTAGTIHPDTQQRILRSILDSSNYDRRIRPGMDNSTDPVEVKVNIFVRSITDIDEKDMDYTMQITLREEWNDHRLSYAGDENSFLVLGDPKELWKPDLFFSNSLEEDYHDVTLPNAFVRIHPNGDVLYSARISLKLACSFDLSYYPLDRQACRLRMASYGYTTDDLAFMWKSSDPVQRAKYLDLRPFNLEKVTTNTCNSKTNTGEYSCLVVELQMKRVFHQYISTLYYPLGLLVSISWAVFWLDSTDATARSLVAVLILLVAVLQSSWAASTLPPSTTARAVDMWADWNIVFLILALGEVIIVIILNRHRKRSQESTQVPDAVVASDGDTELKTLEIATPKKTQNLLIRWMQRYRTAGEKVDGVCRVLFPLVYAIFNFIYWNTYRN